MVRTPLGVNVDLLSESAVSARNRVRVPAGRSYSVNVRLTAEELGDVTAAAARAGLMPTGYTGEGRGRCCPRRRRDGGDWGPSRAGLARVQRDLLAARRVLVCAGADALDAGRAQPAGGDVAADLEWWNNHPSSKGGDLWQRWSTLPNDWWRTYGDVYEALPERLELACPHCGHSELRLEFVAREDERIGFGCFWCDFCLFGIRICSTSVPAGVDFHLMDAPWEERTKIIPDFTAVYPPLDDEPDDQEPQQPYSPPGSRKVSPDASA